MPTNSDAEFYRQILDRQIPHSIFERTKIENPNMSLGMSEDENGFVAYTIPNCKTIPNCHIVGGVRYPLEVIDKGETADGTNEERRGVDASE